MLDGFQDGRLGDFVEHDAAGLLPRQVQRLAKVPGNGLSLAVLIGSQPHGPGLGGQLPELCHHLLFLRGDNVFRLESVGYIYAEFMLFQVPDMADGGLDKVILTQILLDGFHLSGRLYNH